jgi:hypothetical protein
LGLRGYKCECGKTHQLQVCHSNAGYYIGYYCYNPEKGGPISRESCYYATEGRATAALKQIVTGKEDELRYGAGVG